MRVFRYLTPLVSGFQRASLKFAAPDLKSVRSVVGGNLSLILFHNSDGAGLLVDMFLYYIVIEQMSTLSGLKKKGRAGWDAALGEKGYNMNKRKAKTGGLILSGEEACLYNK
jgi:hypothetical protein